jgi:hypothetical protein
MSYSYSNTKEMPQANGGQNIFFTACYRIYALIKPEKVKFPFSYLP